MIKQIKLYKFKCFENNIIRFKDLSLIVGKNNSGKSTIIEALRIISIVSNRFRSLVYKYPPEILKLPMFYKVVSPSTKDLDIDFKTIIFEYQEPPARITVEFQSGAKFDIYITEDNIYAVIFDSEGEVVTSKSRAKYVDVQQVNILPQIGLLLREERLHPREYVMAYINSSLTSIHFRNQLALFEDRFEEFKDLAESTWSGLRLRELLVSNVGENISLLVQDGAFSAEVGWMGNGLQMWLQIMWFLSRVDKNSIVILDEPDVYMHPDLQRKLIRLIKNKYSQAIIATHSVEMISEVEAENILMIDKSKRSASFANNIPGVQKIIDSIGGVHNLQLTRLGSARKCIFVEGKDLNYLKEVYEKIYSDYDEPLDIIPNMSIGGWYNWHYAVGSSIFLSNEMGKSITVYCILDSDYHTPTEINDRLKEAQVKGIQLHIWSKKEIENYFIIPTVICRILNLNERNITVKEVRCMIEEIIDQYYSEVFNGFAEQFLQGNRAGGLTNANKNAKKLLDSKWLNYEDKLSLVSGKEVLSRICGVVKERYNCKISLKAIIREMKKEEIDLEMLNVLNAIHDNTYILSNYI